MTPHKHADVIKAWADGASIECSNDGTFWTSTDKPAWQDDMQYRIKPVEYRIRRQMWLSGDNQAILCVEYEPHNIELVFNNEGRLIGMELIK